MSDAFLLGALCGLRAFTPVACVAWAAFLKLLPLPSRLQPLGTKLGVLLTGLLALGEMVADKLPRMPNRTTPPALVARLLTGGLVGACLGHPLPGALGALLGTYVGFYARTGIVNALGLPDLKVALLEDFLCLAGSLALLYRLV